MNYSNASGQNLAGMPGGAKKSSNVLDKQFNQIDGGHIPSSYAITMLDEQDRRMLID